MLFVLIVLLLVASVFVLLMKKNRESLCLLGTKNWRLLPAAPSTVILKICNTLLFFKFSDFIKFNKW